MRRLVIALFALALAACTTVEYRDSGYYRSGSPGGDYYYGYAYDSPWYDPYDSLFWGLRYSYYDPFYYPNFYYGVTFFPRHYGWGVGWSSWYAWRHWHPYSPYYGSYWDHYYDWWRYQRPHRHADSLDRRMAGRRAGMPGGSGDPVRYGSARNAAERLARQRNAGAVMPIRARAAGAGPMAMPAGSAGSLVTGPDREGLPSRHYGPRTRGQLGHLESAPRQDQFPTRTRERSWRGDPAGMPARGEVERFGMPPAQSRGERTRSLPLSVPSAPARSQRSAPVFTPERSAPAPRMERSMPPSRPSRSEGRSPSTSRRER